MNRRTLWKVSIRTTLEAEDAVTELAGTTFGEPASSYTDVDTGATTVTVYFDEDQRDKAKQTRLEAGLRRLKDCGLDIGTGRISQAKVPREDWAESWKRHFKPIRIGSALLIQPSWSKRHARDGQAVVVLDPGLSFGTGHHPTTAFCLRQLVELRRPGESQSCLDIGTGSGILAIAAAKLGYGLVQAIDSDPDAVRIARLNGRQNHVSGKVHFLHQNAAKLRRRPKTKYALVCANLIANLLVEEHEGIVAQLNAKGALVIAGILKAEFPKVQAAYEAAGLRLVASRSEKEWRSGRFAWQQ